MCHTVVTTARAARWCQIWQILPLPKIIVFQGREDTYLAPDLFRRSMSSSSTQSATFSTGKTKRFFTKSKFDLMISGEYSTNSLRSPPRRWTTFDAILTFTPSPAAVARSRTSNISCLRFSLPIVKFFHECAEVSVKSTIVLPLLCSFRLTLLNCWNMTARYSGNKMVIIVTGYHFVFSLILQNWF